MSQHLHNNPPELKRRISLPVIAGFGFMCAVMVCLPLSQFIADTIGPTTPQVEPQDALPIPEMIIPPPPDEVDTDPDIDEPEEDRERPDLKPMEVIFNPVNYDDLIDNGVYLPGTTQDAVDNIVHDIGDLTKPPRPLRAKSPVFPHELKAAGISGRVLVQYIVRADGSVGSIRILNTTHQAFSDSAIRAIRKWIFQPGEKEGRQVNTRVRQAIPFNIK
ncbi:MAG: energy transducer TonB [Puniceicoccaceae bacterium]